MRRGGEGEREMPWASEAALAAAEKKNSSFTSPISQSIYHAQVNYLETSCAYKNWRDKPFLFPAFSPSIKELTSTDLNKSLGPQKPVKTK